MSDELPWKHGQYIATDAKPDAIAIFDDERMPNDPENDCDSIYRKYGEQFSPCRTVNRTNREHWTSVIAGWSINTPLLDLRNDKTISLP